MTKNQRNRKALKTKVLEALNVEVKGLSPAMQSVLIDDLVTAFESRFDVLSKAQQKMTPTLAANVTMEMECLNETIQA
jgi:hypothetical protein